jgi:hypothetical protein
VSIPSDRCLLGEIWGLGGGPESQGKKPRKTSCNRGVAPITGGGSNAAGGSCGRKRSNLCVLRKLAIAALPLSLLSRAEGQRVCIRLDSATRTTATFIGQQREATLDTCEDGKQRRGCQAHFGFVVSQSVHQKMLCMSSLCFVREKLTPAEFAKAEKIFHERVAYALGSELHRFSVLRRLRERFMHHESADMWKKEFYGCKHSRIYLSALCRPLGSAHSAQANKKAKLDEELSIVGDCVAVILAHGSSSFEQFAAECPSDFCDICELISQQSSLEHSPSLVLFSRALSKCNSDSCVKFMISSFLSWHRVLINLMKKKDDCINGSLMQLLARLSSKEEYCQQLVAQSSDLVVISHSVVSTATRPFVLRSPFTPVCFLLLEHPFKPVSSVNAHLMPQVNSLSSSSDIINDKQRLWACNCLHNLGSCAAFQRVVTSEARCDSKMLLGKGLVAMLKKENQSADAARALINLSCAFGSLRNFFCS